MVCMNPLPMSLIKIPVNSRLLGVKFGRRVKSDMQFATLLVGGHPNPGVVVQGSTIFEKWQGEDPMVKKHDFCSCLPLCVTWEIVT